MFIFVAFMGCFRRDFMDKALERAKLMGEGDISKILWKFAIPAIVSLMISAIYNIVDTMFVGMLNHTASMGAVSIAFPLMLLTNSVGIMFGIGLSSYVARLLGEGKKDKANEAVAVIVFTSIIVAVVITALTNIFLEPILRVLGATDTIMPYALEFVRPLALCSIFPILFPILANGIRSEGNTKYSALAVGVSGVLNIILDPIFMFTFGLGLRGASIATVTSQFVTIIFLLSYYLKGKGLLTIKFENFKPNKKIYEEVLKVGVANLCVQVLMSLSMTLLNISTKPYGDSAIAAIGISTRVSALVIFVVVGYNQGFQPIAGYNYGAKKYDRLKQAINISRIRTTAFSTIASLALWICSKYAISIFSSDPEVIRIGTKALRATILMYPFLGFTLLYNSLFQAIGYGKQAIILSMSRQGIFFIPAIFILPKIFGLNGVLYSQAVADFITLILTVFLAKKMKKDLDGKIEVKAS